MAEPLIPVTALGGTAPKVQGFGPLTLSERPDVALASLAPLRAGQLPDLPLPGPKDLAEAGGLWSFRTTAEAWMILAEGRAEEDFAARIAALAPGCAVTEQTDGWAMIEVTGEAAALERLLEKLVNLDPALLAPGHAARTALHHMGCFVLRPGAGQLWLLGMRSSAGSLWHAVAQAVQFQVVTLAERAQD
ncbi:sarcosine oxidase subunit gamma [Pseudooceanicola sp. CBS1P-1]|uniref:Sarcosine oxidase subunit gamma n=1 Tax=Pseudooceanicola albus TaxID=2692189 RepID=A0A6L7G5I1_9RHOB|nr:MULTISPECIES: sarcosine oxidase subunit gamma [Pseudooceanicola]MBT9385679.1 sarcosine oxidase subunit gamma [Pseudooceanicola endophyticus]MXN18912.1 sarcosine oxidase subunit gamma [Pseudooceanicola albus]